MNWTSEKTLVFINEFKKQKILWDPQNPQHYNKILKNEAWEELAYEMDCSAEECRKKMASLLASLRREKARYNRSVRTGKEGDHVYKSSWFAYKSLIFMLNRNIRPNLDTEEVSNSNPINEESNEINSTKKDEDRINRKRKIDSNREMVQSTFEILQTSANRTDDDEFRSFGNFIANKLKSYSKHTKNYVQHIISNIIFSADQGEFDYQQTTTQTHSYHPFQNNSTGQEQAWTNSSHDYTKVRDQSSTINSTKCGPVSVSSPSTTYTEHLTPAVSSPAITDNTLQNSDDEDVKSFVTFSGINEQL